MHLAHCLKASVTSPEWPFFPPNSGIWILLQNPSFFFLLPPLEVVDLAEWELSELSPLLLPLLPQLLLPFLREEGSIRPTSEVASSSEVRGYGPCTGEGTLPTEEVVERREREKLALGLLPSCLCRSLAVSANLGGGGAAWGWKGAAVAERPEDWCREVRRSWKYRRSCLQFSCSSLLHPARISLASVRLTHFTFHLAVRPIHVRISVTAWPASMATSWMRPALELPFWP